MIGTPTIAETPAHLTVVIHVTTPRDEIQEAMGGAIGELLATLGEQGVVPAGSIFSHHFAMNPDTFDFEVGVPVETAVSAASRMQPGEAPAMTVARTVYHGDYDGLGSAWGEFDQWLAVSGRPQAPDLWERYLTDPSENPAPATWQTELIRPLAR